MMPVMTEERATQGGGEAAASDKAPRPGGWVALVGAGPGDAGLITVRGLDRLRTADVVVYDALANPALLEQARADALRIDAGKRARAHRLTQDQTNALLAEHALAGRGVCRLKGGDPYLFGRGAEEAMYLADRGVAVEVVCGVTSGIAAPAAAGVPVTLRGVASTVTFVTGHEDPTKERSSVDYAALGRLVTAGGTACIYMGVGRLARICRALHDAGVPDDMPVGVTQWGTTPRQRAARGTLATIADVVADRGLGAPAIVVVGRVVHPHDGPIDDAAGVAAGLDWFTRRPLFGQTVLVTRTRQQASRLTRRLAELGAEVLEAPTIELAPPRDRTPFVDAVREVGSFDWLVLTSAAGVDALADELADTRRDARALADTRVAAVGHATAAALRDRLAITADLIPPDANGDALADALLDAGVTHDTAVLLLRADLARPALPRRLARAGADVVEAVAYETRRVDALPGEVVEAFRDGRIDWTAFTSGSTARNLADLLGEALGGPPPQTPDAADPPDAPDPPHAPGAAAMRGVRVASIGPITSQAVAACGWSVEVESEQASVPALVDAIVRAVATRPADAPPPDAAG
jgi:uroporphyrinogen III methyltransferase/synthase